MRPVAEVVKRLEASAPLVPGSSPGSPTGPSGLLQAADVLPPRDALANREIALVVRLDEVVVAAVDRQLGAVVRVF